MSKRPAMAASAIMRCIAASCFARARMMRAAVLALAARFLARGFPSRRALVAIFRNQFASAIATAQRSASVLNSAGSRLVAADTAASL